MKKKNILLVGYGNMGRALASGWVAKGMQASCVIVADPNPDAQSAATAAGHALLADMPVSQHIDVVVFATKPQATGDLLGNYSTFVTNGALVVSIVAGMRLQAFTSAFGESAAIVRAMPNTPAAIGKAMTVLVASRAVSADERENAAELLAAVGRVAWVDDEALMDAVTALSGSGPAYVFLLIECLVSAGVKAGLPEDLAAELATATVGGAGAYAEAADADAKELRSAVTSPGGTTEAALGVLTRDDIMERLFQSAIRIAAERSRELSKL